MNNLFTNVPSGMPEELVEVLLSASDVRIERIISHGHAQSEPFWYDQPWHEWVVVLQGMARLRFEGESQLREMHAGDFINISAHRRHRVEWTTPDQPTVWLAIHYAESGERGAGSRERGAEARPGLPEIQGMTD